MKNNVYVIYNTLSNRYGMVMTYATDAVASKAVAKLCESGVYERDETELCRIGKIDIETGVIEPESPVRIEIEDKKIPIEEAKTGIPNKI